MAAGCRVLLAAALGCLLLGGSCAEEATTLDQAGTERAVERVIGVRIAPDIDAIRCPGEIERGEGERIECTALLAEDAGVVRLQVTQTDDDATLEAELLDAVLDRTEVAEDLRQTLVDSYLRTFTVDCGEPPTLVIEPDDTFTCDATDDDPDADDARTVEVTVVDAAGTLSYDVGT